MKQTQYVAREPDAQGFIDYPPQEHAVWNTLITRQLKVIEGRACQEYLDGIDQLNGFQRQFQHGFFLDFYHRNYR